MPWFVQSLLISVSMSMDAFAVSISNGLTNKKMPVKYMIITALSFGLFQGVMPLIGYLLGSIFEEWIEVALPIIGFAVLAFLGIKMIVDSAKEIKEDKKLALSYQNAEKEQAEESDENIVVEDATNGANVVATTVEGNVSVALTEDVAQDGSVGSVADSVTEVAMPLEEDKPFKFSWKMLLVQSIATSIDALTIGLVYIGKEPLEVYVTFALIALVTFGICTGGVFFGKKFGTKLKNWSGIFGGVILLALALKTIIEFLVERFA